MFRKNVATLPLNIFVYSIIPGINDVSWNNPEVLMPNMDDIVSKGIILDQAYAQPVCSPSRGAFMTGLYPFHNGMQV